MNISRQSVGLWVSVSMCHSGLYFPRLRKGNVSPQKRAVLFFFYHPFLEENPSGSWRGHVRTCSLRERTTASSIPRSVFCFERKETFVCTYQSEAAWSCIVTSPAYKWTLSARSPKSEGRNLVALLFVHLPVVGQPAVTDRPMLNKAILSHPRSE